MTTLSIPQRCKAPQTCEKYGDPPENPLRETASNMQMTGQLNKCFLPEYWQPRKDYLKDGAYVKLSDWIKHLQQLQQKIMKLTKKRLLLWHLWYNIEDSSTFCWEHTTSWEHSCKNNKAFRHWISPDTSSLLRKWIASEFNSKINSNLSKKVFQTNIVKWSKILDKNQKVLNWIKELFHVPCFNKIKKILRQKLPM